ncbi:MAG: tryptophan synthase subunit alpha [Verrucomicrobiota bacterium]
MNDSNHITFHSSSPGNNSSPNRIDALFASLKAEGRTAMIAYITGGDPALSASAKIAIEMEKAGVDLLELGIPFSDPLADGATIQMASGRALAAGATVPGIIELVREIRQASQIPIVLFAYLNPIYIYGFEKFQTDAIAAGADGLLLLDLPPQEAARNTELSSDQGLKAIRLIAPTTPPERLKEITDAAEGFIYYVSREGVTGEQTSLSTDIAERVAAIRALTEVPVAVGFGISNPEQAATVAGLADGVVVGSAIVRRIAEIGDTPELPAKIADFVRPIAEAVHGTKG